MSTSTNNTSVGIGHNSQIAEMLEERNHWRERALKAEAERDIANTKLGRISRIYRRDDISSRAKSIATAILVNADMTGRVQFSTSQMALAASLSDRKAVVSAIDELAAIRMVTADRPSGGRRPTLFSLLPEEVLTEAVGAVRAQREASATEGKTNSEASPLGGYASVACATEGKPPSFSLRGNLSVVHATEGTTTGLNEQFDASSKKTFPPRPPLSPHTPLSPPIVPPIEKESSLVSSPRISESVAARNVRGGVFTDPALIANCRDLGIELEGDFIRHQNFTINLQTAYLADLHVPKATAANSALSLALQWATEIAAGKPPANVVPKFINSVVERVVQKRHVNGAVDANIIERASKSSQTMPNRHNGSTYSRNWRDA